MTINKNVDAFDTDRVGFIIDFNIKAIMFTKDGQPVGKSVALNPVSYYY